jgi:starch phosphorylase
LYSGGLGILAGDTIKSCADLGVPMVGISLLYDEGYFHQTIEHGEQYETPVQWVKEEFLKPLPQRIKINIEGRDIYIQPWQYTVFGAKGEVPVYFLSTNLPENSEWDRTITKQLYGGDRWYRLCQEMILGIGGVKLLRALGYGDSQDATYVRKYHMNEGHSSFLTLELHKEAKRKYLNEEEPFHMNHVKNSCVFTTHTPVPAGHDNFPMEQIRNAFRDYYDLDYLTPAIRDNKLNMTYLALMFSENINGVAKKHRDVSKKMFPGYQIDAITNGVHSVTWTCPQFKKLYDEYIPGWRKDNYTLRYSLNIPGDKIWDAHMGRKRELIEYINTTQNAGFDYETLTIGFARRAATYKRSYLIFYDVNRLKKICKEHPLQIVISGKAHPNDGAGKALIKELHEKIAQVSNHKIKIVYLPNYEMWLGQLLTSGVDVWLNTPKRPLESSGTNGMQSAHNGVQHFSVLDG